MIPKLIHYCWFGRNPLPDLAVKCIASWKKYFPEYKIVEWNEDNFDVNIIQYTQQAYSIKKYAFVSDYARFWILYNFGGLYFDTDVEVIKSMDDIINRGSFMGIEVEFNNKPPLVAPGLGLGVSPGLDLYKKILDYYQCMSFFEIDGKPNKTTVVKHTTNILIENGLIQSNKIQEVAGVWIYPVDYFNPLNSLTGKLKITDNTRSIHWYMNSWSDKPKLYLLLSKFSHRILGLSFNKLKFYINKILA